MITSCGYSGDDRVRVSVVYAYLYLCIINTPEVSASIYGYRHRDVPGWGGGGIKCTSSIRPKSPRLVPHKYYISVTVAGIRDDLHENIIIYGKCNSRQIF